MGFFSSLFGKKKEEKTYLEVGVGVFTYDGIHFNIHRWDCNIGEASISVIGNFEKPFDNQIELIRNLESLLFKLNGEIIKTLKDLSNNAEFENNFKSWDEKFILIAADFDDYYSKKLWCFTLEEKNEIGSQYYFELEEDKIISCTVDS